MTFYSRHACSFFVDPIGKGIRFRNLKFFIARLPWWVGTKVSHKIDKKKKMGFAVIVGEAHKKKTYRSLPIVFNYVVGVSGYSCNTYGCNTKIHNLFFPSIKQTSTEPKTWYTCALRYKNHTNQNKSKAWSRLQSPLPLQHCAEACDITCSFFMWRSRVRRTATTTAHRVLHNSYINI